MNLTSKIDTLQSSAERQLHALSSSKKTENALILPFFEALGYDPFNVREVEPDFEVGREGEGMRTVDYAVKKDGSAIMLFECAEAKTDLDAVADSDLFQYFDEIEADVAAFTNGLSYRFYANLDGDLSVGELPFLEFNLLDYGAEQMEVLKRLTKPVFDGEKIRAAAHELRSSRLLRDYLARQTEAPDDHFVRFLAAQVFEGEVSGELLDHFRPVVRKVLGEFVEGEIATDSAETTPEEETSDAPASEEDLELSSSDDDSFEDVDELDADEEGSGPFEKDLARRVIEDF